MEPSHHRPERCGAHMARSQTRGRVGAASKQASKQASSMHDGRQRFGSLDEREVHLGLSVHVHLGAWRQTHGVSPRAFGHLAHDSHVVAADDEQPERHLGARVVRRGALAAAGGKRQQGASEGWVVLTVVTALVKAYATKTKASHATTAAAAAAVAGNREPACSMPSSP